MEWYYADGQKKCGPLSEAEIQSLVASGQIQPTTLVWNKSFDGWKPAGESGLFTTTPSDSDSQKCIITGKIFPIAQMIKTQHGWVSAEGKDRYYQSLRENSPIPTAPGMSNAKRDGKKIVIPVSGGQLPARCVKTGQPVTEAEMKSKVLYWCTPWAALSILLSVIIYLILYLVMRKKVVVRIPLSATGRSIVRRHGFISAGLAFGGIAVVILGIINVNSAAWMIFPGALMTITGLIYALLKAHALKVTKINNGEAWMAGASPEFLASLPEY